MNSLNIFDDKIDLASKYFFPQNLRLSFISSMQSYVTEKSYFQAKKFPHQHVINEDSPKQRKASCTKEGVNSELRDKSFYVIISHVREITFWIRWYFTLSKWGPERAAVCLLHMSTEGQSCCRDPTGACIFKDLSICIHFHSVLWTVSQYLNSTSCMQKITCSKILLL